jgi:hypothetical protein
MLIKPDQFFQEMADLMNKALAEMPDDETRQAVLDSFSKQMFCDTRKAQEKC